MHPGKKSTRAGQLQPQPVPFDYDTDTANVTDALAASVAPPPQRTNTELNLLALRRHVPGIERIISVAPFVVVYQYLPESQEWEKAGTEGTLFVCQLAPAASPRYNVVILNRKSLENFVVDLKRGEDVDINDPYVYLRETAEDGSFDKVHGLWIFSDDNVQPNAKQMVVSAIQGCAIRAEHSRRTQEAVQTPPSSHSAGPRPSVAAPSQPVPVGRLIEVSSLFSQPDTKNGFREANGVGYQPPPQPAPQPPRFSSSADTAFFRGAPSPAMTQWSQNQSSVQQNALLSLFNSGYRG